MTPSRQVSTQFRWMRGRQGRLPGPPATVAHRTVKGNNVTHCWVRETAPMPVPVARRSRKSSPREFHMRIPGYRATPLLRMPDLARQLGLGDLLLKFENERFELPSFKSLGAFWAVYRWLDSVYEGGLDGSWDTFGALRDMAARLGEVTLVTATDGNHGRAVAKAASVFGFAAHVLVPKGTAASRIDAIRGEGAVVEVVPGDYDKAVTTAARLADDRHVVISDTSWPGYTRIPGWIAEGYFTLFEEMDEDMAGFGLRAPDALIVPVGVGALAQAAIEHCSRPSAGTAVIAVEPAGSACVLESLLAGRLVSVPGPHRSIMAGLNCGTPSMVAWPTLMAGLSGAVALDDAYAMEAMRLLASADVAVGETGAASLGALLALRDGAFEQVSRALDLSRDSVVAVLCTEAVTDPVNYALIVENEAGEFAESPGPAAKTSARKSRVAEKE